MDVCVCSCEMLTQESFFLVVEGRCFFCTFCFYLDSAVLSTLTYVTHIHQLYSCVLLQLTGNFIMSPVLVLNKKLNLLDLFYLSLVEDKCRSKTSLNVLPPKCPMWLSWEIKTTSTMNHKSRRILREAAEPVAAHIFIQYDCSVLDKGKCSDVLFKCLLFGCENCANVEVWMFVFLASNSKGWKNLLRKSVGLL